MKNKYRNIFLGFGIIAVVIMLFTFDMSYEELWSSLKRAGYYLPLVLLLWLFIYLINTLSWYIIIRSGGERGGLTFTRLYKFTVSGFALNYVTPVGLMGGEPYRIMELTPYIGVFLLLGQCCPYLCFILSGGLGNGNCAYSDHFILCVACFSFCEGVPARDGSGMCSFR